MTLVEAVLGIGLLGTLLVSLLAASSRLTVQDARSRRRIEACKVADGLLEAWWPRRGDFPRAGSGKVPGQAGWTWRTRVVRRESADALHVAVVVLDVFAPGTEGPDPAARVEVLVAKEEQEEDDAASGSDAG